MPISQGFWKDQGGMSTNSLNDTSASGAMKTITMDFLKNLPFTSQNQQSSLQNFPLLENNLPKSKRVSTQDESLKKIKRDTTKQPL